MRQLPIIFGWRFGVHDSHVPLVLEMAYKIFFVCVWLMTHTEYVRKYDTRHRPNFWQFSSNWRGRDQKPSFACLKISASIIKSHHQTDSNKTPSKYWRNHFYIQIRKWGMRPTETKGTARNPPFSLQKTTICFKRNFWGSCVAWMLYRSCRRNGHRRIPCCPWWQCVFFWGWTIWHCQGIVDSCNGLWR